MEVATLGGGCFWCTEAVYKRVKGVISVKPGYSGGHVPNPTYEDVCTDTTGHAEVVQITFDSSIISYREILEIFFEIHDPTTLNRQGNDVGTQYRSIILYHNEEQRKIAEEMIREVEKRIGKKVVTELKPFEVFYEAEDYHHDFYDKHKYNPYCRLVISPKVKKFMKLFPDKVKIHEG
ncbi:peptide-methionine (S)-S-oxide reductase MsrA [Saccharolobus solfataricus]|uniref:Peptide methionine sulfoxide reductase MsrA n=3 Tax=Saccharolobus solfataricus TaxID=2287 RepID=MSRA_SACS2|nr:peptide-methionine (S)-S-oxide reductase MsrA [Saccharolobus solfataricus]Q97Y45.1 RecName: Full=Peptide methionine sulfoxide reductase MsrA; Short=Protein-methionine-S-oxide reductase; AltName: Full=Peptide-methionine (S)-S-oxide reductase; Short=Peptide Met(O) reductase [Saccharolobus solfataricus P2]AAK41726.1 Peptide methionine sulfoxide reductase (msr) [Saccharolobus solfataricus P2]QPG48863.1 peptide-methionine (S)-S-oxide reductase MsrA [Saccharolobus solfataricus]SAI85165.1 methionin